MTQSAVVEESSHRLVVAGHWGALACLAFSAALFPLLVIPVPWLLPIVLTGAMAGVIALMLSIQARRSGFPRRLGRRALVIALSGILTNALLIGCVIVSVAMTSEKISRVALSARGESPLSVEYSDGRKTYTENWPSVGLATFNSKQSWAKIAVTTQDRRGGSSVSCEIRWDGVVVVSKTSDSGAVLCRYDAD